MAAQPLVAGDMLPGGATSLASEQGTARLVARQMLMADDPDDNDISDAIGELANTIAGAVKTNHAECGNVALGLPLIVAGPLRAISEPPTSADASMSLQCMGVTIPFYTAVGSVSLKIMVYM